MQSNTTTSSSPPLPRFTAVPRRRPLGRNPIVKEMGRSRARVLLALAASDHPLERQELAERADVDSTYLTNLVGAHDEERRLRNDEKSGLSLISRGLVRLDSEQRPNGSILWTYRITVKGVALAERIKSGV